MSTLDTDAIAKRLAAVITPPKDLEAACGEFIGQAGGDIAALLAEVATLREALKPFALIAGNHEGDTEDDSRQVSIINAINRRYPDGNLHGDVWYQNGGEFGAHLTRGDLRRARSVLEGEA